MRVALALACLLAPLVWASDGPELLVLCEHYDVIVPFAVDARGGLSPSAPPTEVRAPHDALYLAPWLYVSAEYKGQPCLISYQASADGRLKRVGDPVPTLDRDPGLVALPGGKSIAAWSRAHVQVFPLIQGVASPPRSAGAGFEALVWRDGWAFALGGGRVSSHRLDADGISAPLYAAPAGFGATSVALDPLGRTLFVLTLEDFNRHLRLFEISGDGRLSLSGDRPPTPEEAQRRLVATDRALYVLNASNTITTYLRSEGRWRPDGRPVKAGDGLADLVVTDRMAYAVGEGDPLVRMFRVDAKNARLHPTRPVSLPGEAAGTRLVRLW
jgi:hypothetical protein